MLDNVHASVFFLQQKVDEMGDVLEDRRRGRHMAVFYTQFLLDFFITSTGNIVCLRCFVFYYFIFQHNYLESCKYSVTTRVFANLNISYYCLQVCLDFSLRRSLDFIDLFAYLK